MSPWQEVLPLFETNDGSLPDVYVANLSPGEVVDVYDWVMSQCSIWGSPTTWSNTAQIDVLIASLPSPGRSVVEGEVDYFRHGLADLAIDGVLLPELTICLEGEGYISFDYRKGPEWTEATINAFFELLARIRRRAPGARIWHSTEGGFYMPGGYFAITLRQFEAGRR